MSDRQHFEKWLAEVHGFFGEDIAFDDKRGCYRTYGIHLAYQAWLAGKSSAGDE
ncbi:TPA: hypothetical protein ACS72K_003881 [Providencia alcalifaciens]